MRVYSPTASSIQPKFPTQWLIPCGQNQNIVFPDTNYLYCKQVHDSFVAEPVKDPWRQLRENHISQDASAKGQITLSL